MSSYRVYVGTFGKYAAGSLKGKWLDLEDYNDKEEFMKACQELHADEHDPEFMFQDHEGIPSQFIGESWIDEKLWDYLNSDIDDEVKEAFMYLFDEWDEEWCEGSYIGEFDNRTKLAEHLVDERGVLGEIPESMQYYFDYEAYGQDLELGGDVSEHNHHYFWANYRHPFIDKDAACRSL